MSFNREKGAFAVVLLIFLAGMYSVAVDFLSPARSVRIPKIDIPRSEGGVPRIEYRRYQLSGVPPRNPFSSAEGWQRLEKPPLSPPRLPARARVLPSLSRSVPPQEGGIFFFEADPVPASGKEGGPSAATEPGSKATPDPAGAPGRSES